MKFSIITTVLNGIPFIKDCTRSVAGQTYEDIEYIVIDGGSTDGTLDAIRAREDVVSKWVSGPDSGMYGALNRGIAMASGSVIGFLHADDVYAHERVIEKVAAKLKDTDADSCYGDLIYVGRQDNDRIVRRWKSREYRRGLFRHGFMPPHPTFFVKKSVYDKHGLFDLSFRISADYELMLRFLERHGVSTCYIPEVLVKMRTGGISNLSVRNILAKTAEDFRAWRDNGLSMGASAVALKNLTKIPQLF